MGFLSTDGLTTVSLGESQSLQVTSKATSTFSSPVRSKFRELECPRQGNETSWADWLSTL